MTKQQAVRHFETQTALAKAAKVSRQAVSQWESVPDAQQIWLENLTKGALMADRRCWRALGLTPPAR